MTLGQRYLDYCYAHLPILYTSTLVPLLLRATRVISMTLYCLQSSKVSITLEIKSLSCPSKSFRIWILTTFPTPFPTLCPLPLSSSHTSFLPIPCFYFSAFARANSSPQKFFSASLHSGLCSNLSQ